MFLDGDISKGPRTLRNTALGCKTDKRLLRFVSQRGSCNHKVFYKYILQRQEGRAGPRAGKEPV